MEENTLLNELREIALRIQIDPKESIGHAAKLDSILKVLSQIKKSYENFLEIELTKNEEFNRISKNSSSILEFLLQELELIAVDVDFGSFEIALAPDVVQKGKILFSDFAMELKESSFKSYKELINGDFRDLKYMSAIGNKYTEEERRKIYKPIFNLTSPDYKVNIKDRDGKVARTIVRPSKEKQRFYLPRVPRELVEDDTSKTVLAYVDVNKEGEEIKLSTRNIKKIHYVEELEHDTYPFTPIEIVFEDFIVEFHERLKCEVTYEDDLYFVANEDLGITAWGESRELAEEAFRFNVYSIYKNFYSEAEENLSNDAIELKELLFRITKKYSG